MKSYRHGNRVLLSIAFACPIACTGMLAAEAAAQVSIGVGISLPTPIVFVAPPQVVVLPGFDIYVVPDISDEIYFVDGYWWRPWQGHWYRSQYYDNGWSQYGEVPYFYSNVRQGWRDDYRNHRWEGQEWNYERIPHQRVEQNWSSWKSSNYWQGKQNWGVPNMKGGKHAQDAQAREPQTQQRAVERAPQVQSSPAAQRSSQPKAAQQQHRDAQPKAAPPQQHPASPPKAAQSQQRSSQPKAASSQHGGAPPQAQKQHSQQPKGGSQSKGHEQGDNKGQGQPAGQHGGGKDKK